MFALNSKGKLSPDIEHMRCKNVYVNVYIKAFGGWAVGDMYLRVSFYLLGPVLLSRSMQGAVGDVMLGGCYCM
jgi:hypothetical protein